MSEDEQLFHVRHLLDEVVDVLDLAIEMHREQRRKRSKPKTVSELFRDGQLPTPPTPGEPF